MTRKPQHLLTLLLHFLLILPGVVLAASSAEVSAADQPVTTDQLLGSWKLEGTAHKKGAAVNPENQTWNFRSDGTLKSVAEDHRAADTISLIVKYKLEDGALLVERVGRSGRWNRFKVLEVSDTAMTLKGGIEGFMFFKRIK